MAVINKHTALTTALTTLLAAAPRGTKLHSLERLRTFTEGDYFSLDVERSWGVSCIINVSMRFGSTRKFRIADGTAKPALPRNSNKRDVEVTLPTYGVHVEVNWSCMGRTVAQAQAAVALYQECTNVAAEIEAALDGAIVYQTADLDFAMGAEQDAS